MPNGKFRADVMNDPKLILTVYSIQKCQQNADSWTHIYTTEVVVMLHSLLRQDTDTEQGEFDPSTLRHGWIPKLRREAWKIYFFYFIFTLIVLFPYVSVIILFARNADDNRVR